MTHVVRSRSIKWDAVLERSGRSRIGDDRMLIPVRCWSCGKVIAHVYEQYKQAVESGEDAQSTLENLGIERYCCRRMFVGHVDLLDEISPFSIARDQQ
jgi:DNA-directed RNA polymerase subunit N